MRLFLAFFLTLAGCVSPPTLVRAKYRPKREGVIKIERGGPGYAEYCKQESKKIMNKFCAPNLPDIVEIDHESSPSGATSSQFAGVTITDINFDDNTLIHFRCLEVEDKTSLSRSTIALPDSASHE